MDIRDVSIIHHIGIVFALIWILSYYSCCNPVVYVLSIFYLYQVHDRYIARLRKKLQFEERKQANQRRVLADSETVRWLNHAVEKVWPICMEQIASQKVLLPIVPWFLEKYKPWTAKKAVVQHLYLGRNPPTFTEMRVLRQCQDDDDHLVMELGMNFLTADDMSAILAVKLRRRLGFGMWAKMHVTGMHIEGKVLVGVKFLPEYPFLGRLRVCFVEPPYFQMTVKPMFSHGIDVTELPGIAGWLDKLLAVVFEQTLVEPNMLVVDVEKFVSAPTENNWFSVNEKDPIAYAKVEVVEGAEMKPSDPNGLADPYVKGQLGPYRFRTKIQKKTLSPKWHEEFKIPICTWESPNVLVLEVCDKDHFRDDTLGDCSINITDLRGRQKEDMWLPLQNIKMGKLHLVVTVIDADAKEGDHIHDEKPLNSKPNTVSAASETAEITSDSTVSPQKTQKVPDEFEPINIEGQEKTGIWVHHPGSDVSRIREPRKRKSRQSDIEIHREDNDSNGSSHSNGSGSNNFGNSSSDENGEGHRSKSFNSVKKGLRKIGLAIHKIHTKEDPSTTPVASPTPRVNLRAVNDRGTNLNFIMDDNMHGNVKGSKTDKEILSTGTSEAETPTKGNMKGAAKNFLKHSAHSLKHVLSRKGSNKNKDDSGSVTTETDHSRISDVSNGEPLSSSMPVNPTVGNIPTASAISTHDKETPNYTEQNVQVGVSDPATKVQEPPITKVPVQGVEQDIRSFSDVREGLDEKKSSSNTVNESNSVAAEKCSSNYTVNDVHPNVAFSSTMTH